MEGPFCFMCTEFKNSQTFISGSVNNLASHLQNNRNVRTANKESEILLVCSQNGCEETISSLQTSVITLKYVARIG